MGRKARDHLSCVVRDSSQFRRQAATTSYRACLQRCAVRRLEENLRACERLYVLLVHAIRLVLPFVRARMLVDHSLKARFLPRARMLERNAPTNEKVHSHTSSTCDMDRYSSPRRSVSLLLSRRIQTPPLLLHHLRLQARSRAEAAFNRERKLPCSAQETPAVAMVKTRSVLRQRVTVACTTGRAERGSVGVELVDSMRSSSARACGAAQWR